MAGGRDDDDDEIPKIGRGKTRLRVPPQQIIAIVAAIIALVAVLALREGCAQGVANMFRAFELDAGPADAAR